MSAPTLSFGGTTVTLPYPLAGPTLGRAYGETGGERRTLGGYLRRWATAYWHTYTLGFEDAAETTYDAIVTLIRAATLASSAVTFTWSSGPWPSATSGVLVSAHVSEMRPSASGSFSVVDFDLTLQEVNPR